MIKLLMLVLISSSLVGCGSKKVVVRNCEKAGNADVFVCDPL